MDNHKKLYTAMGLMSGTSYDGVDVAILETDGYNHIVLKEAITLNYNNKVKTEIAKLITGDYSNIWSTEKALSNFHVEAAHTLINKYKVDIIGFHGQTIYHNPSDKITIQLGNPHILATALNKDVIYDFRRKDVAHGGQGAPLIPIFLKAIKPKNINQCCFLNIGGVANICYIDNENLIAFDVGPGNAPLDDLCKIMLNQSFDNKGIMASKGIVNEALLNNFKADKFYLKKFPKSLDRNYFDFSIFKKISLNDALATIVELIAHSIKTGIEMLPFTPSEIIVSGGGVHNTFMLKRIEQLISIKLSVSDNYNLPADYLEAYGFGYLAVRSLLNLPISFPLTTGISVPMRGGVLVKDL